MARKRPGDRKRRAPEHAIGDLSVISDKVTFGALQKLLLDAGFTRLHANGPYVLFEHPASNALQAFRAHRGSEIADPMTIASVRKTLVGFGFMDEKEFEESLGALDSKRTSKAR